MSDEAPLGAPVEAPTPGPIEPPPAPITRKTPVRAIVITIAVLVVVIIGAVIGTTFVLRSLVAAQQFHYSSAAFGYRVTLPGKPAVSKSTTDTGSPTETIQWNGAGRQIITIEAAEAPKTIPTDRYSAVLTGALAGSAKSFGDSHPTDDTKFTLDGQPAESERMISAAAGPIYEVVTLKGARIYVIVVSPPKTAVEHSVVGSFAFAN